ncbi:NAD-dependent epimerase/dehydratase family protein [Paenibacillus sp. NFR01]|uniref:NAD-dependent epimerase/dehydratase family protein n=1 Tax=Paenibacillus sp. NFR01 TaxID=1566279 RepID=UPI0008BA386C|nr:NAD-dependent epimerase/dehydratase family protein [Paenibacillus sp. NFR01]SEU18617.1 Nucleoside-diphosphate-sugar epimerase [Paenibacillus sp. NFR01]
MDEVILKDESAVRRILVTGAAGFTGRHAVRYFHGLGAEVTAAVREPSADGGIFPAGVREYACDLSDRAAVQRMVEEVRPQEVLHLAGRNSVPESWKDPLHYMEANVMATLYLLEALRGAPARRILVAGSRLKYRPGVDAGPPHPYSLSKTLEALVSLAWGMLFKQPVLLAEPCNLIGPGPSTGFCSLLAQHIVRSEDAAASGGALPIFSLSSRYARRDFLDVRDAVRAYDCILCAGEPGRVYRIDSGTMRELGGIAEKMLALAQTEVQMDWGGDAGASARSETPQAAESSPEEESAESLGWRPGMTLDQSLADIMEYYRAGRKGRSS